MKRREFFAFFFVPVALAKADSWLREGLVGYRSVASSEQKAFGKSCLNCRYYLGGFCKLPAAMSEMKSQRVRVKAEGCCDSWVKDH